MQPKRFKHYLEYEEVLAADALLESRALRQTHSRLDSSNTAVSNILGLGFRNGF